MEETTYSRIISGCMNWGIWDKKFSSRQIIDMLEYALEIGITTFDHADIYGGYTTENDFGKAFAESKIARERIQLITKCGIQMHSEVRPNVIKHYEYSAAYIISSVERSLQNLRTDYIDMLLLHRPSPLMNPEIIAEAITRLRNDGKIRDFGVSNFTPSQIAMLEKAIPVASNQIEFSLTANDAMNNGCLDDSITHDRMMMSWSPLGSFFKEKAERALRIQKVMQKMKEKYRATEDQLLLAWVLKHPSKIHPVVGTTTKSRLKNAIAAQQIAMELTDWYILLEASRGHEVA
ncbi:aldo/keto reductase [Aggregatimonas sangjinii]|uniref:Aldo/keto reductase n=1 Tax=Aggregatimonas sangjinii TaxID=2583587 RepID=A0A5B7SXQ2_9FLAO|nr:aldo/keto reductase [Aggregatimonas sangjinii]QCX02069.1 aldo/keto reductase [Aggregatimonas sangjinii]